MVRLVTCARPASPLPDSEELNCDTLSKPARCPPQPARLQVKNCTDLPLRVGIKSPVSKEFSFKKTVAGGEQLTLPSLRAESSMLHIQPAGAPCPS